MGKSAPITAATLHAHAILETDEGSTLLRHICAQIEDHGLRAVAAKPTRFVFEECVVELDAGPDGVRLDLWAPDAAHLDFMRLRAETYVESFSQAVAAGIKWHGDVAPRPTQALRLVKRREILPGLARFTFDIPDGGASVGPCWHLRLVLAGPRGETTRFYTIRAYRPETGEIDIDVLLHGPDALAGWAMRACVGDRIGARDPFGTPPAFSRPVILAGDMSAAPAMARILAINPRASGLVMVAGPAGVEEYLRAPRSMEFCRVAPDADLAAHLVPRIVQSVGSDARGHDAWFAGEANAARSLRQYFAQTLGIPPGHRHSAAYWRRTRL